MSAVATNFTNFKMGAAASAIAAAAILTPAAVAAAKPDLMPTSPVTHIFDTGPSLGPVQFSTDAPWWWVGDRPNPKAAAAIAPLATPGTTIFEFTPLSFVPGFLKPVVGWFLSFIPQFNVCVGGLGVSVGPYGSVSVKTGAC
jgi:hypothetical protein